MRLWLEKLRKDKNLSKKAMANGLNVSIQYYSLIENGKRQADMNLSVASKIADFFNISLSTIRNYEEKMLQQTQKGA